MDRSKENPMSPIKILLVEDSKFLRIATERALIRAGYAVSCAEDGEQAIQMAQERLPDLILLDMLLPKTSGHDVLIALKKEIVTADIPVVVLTGLSVKNADRLKADGAFAFLEKSTLELDKGARVLLAMLADIIKTLPKPESRRDNFTPKSARAGSG
jgi:CheY-like chemotaxis protein